MSDVKFTVMQPYPEDNGAITTPAGGSWSANTFSFKVSVVYDGEDDVDNFGVDRAQVVAWENITTAANDQVIIPVTLDTSRAFSFVICYQVAATYNVAAVGVRIKDSEVSFTQSSATEYVITLASGDSDGNLAAYGAAASTLEFSAPATMTYEGTEQAVRDAWGDTIQKSNVTNRDIDMITITYSPVISVPSGGLATLHRWKSNQVYLKLENTSGATSPKLPVSGVIGALSQLDTRTQNQFETVTFIVDVEGIT